MTSNDTKSRKKKNEPFMHSANPELWAKANKPTSTIAMGMKSNQLSSECWRKQVQREKQIAAEWYKAHKSQKHTAHITEASNDNDDADDNVDNELKVSLHNTLARELAAHDLYHNPSLNPELHYILYKTADDVQTALNVSSDHHNSKTYNNNNKNNNSSSSKTTVCNGNIINHNSTVISNTAIAADVNAPVIVNPSLERKTLSKWEQQGLPTTQLYLKARAQNHLLPERYPHGPSTSSQVIGWNATQCHSESNDTDVYRINPELYKPYQQHQSSTFHRPDDKEHAQLFGYDFDVK